MSQERQQTAEQLQPRTFKLADIHLNEKINKCPLVYNFKQEIKQGEELTDKQDCGQRKRQLI